MAGLNFSTIDGDLTLNGIPMKTRAWACLDLTTLWMPPAIRGEDRILPGAAGVVANRRRKTVTQYALDFTIVGLANQYGDENDDDVDWFDESFPNFSIAAKQFIMLEYNLEYLRDNVLDVRTSPNLDGTVAGVLTMPSGVTRTADVHVLGFTANTRVSNVINGILDISIPIGGFV
jgi:hypothetical protein